jgi:hypothetical protein
MSWGPVCIARALRLSLGPARLLKGGSMVPEDFDILRKLLRPLSEAGVAALVRAKLLIAGRAALARRRWLRK